MRCLLLRRKKKNIICLFMKWLHGEKEKNGAIISSHTHTSHPHIHTNPAGVQTLGKVTCVELPAANYDFAQWCSSRAQNKASASSDVPLNMECKALMQLPDLYALLVDMLAADPARRQALKRPHIVGTFCHYSRSLMTLNWSAQALRARVPGSPWAGVVAGIEREAVLKLSIIW